jgi:hypothetical protein
VYVLWLLAVVGLRPPRRLLLRLLGLLLLLLLAVSVHAAL